MKAEARQLLSLEGRFVNCRPHPPGVEVTSPRTSHSQPVVVLSLTAGEARKLADEVEALARQYPVARRLAKRIASNLRRCAWLYETPPEERGGQRVDPFLKNPANDGDTAEWPIKP